MMTAGADFAQAIDFALRVQPGAPAEAAASPPVRGLSTAEADALFRGVAPISREPPALPGSFPAKREKIRAPERPLAPAPAAPLASPDDPVLRVERITPQGDVDDAQELTIAFSQQMVALSGNALGSDDPVSSHIQIAPALPGRLHWLGTRLLAFTPDGAMPHATELVVRVKKGLRSLSGAVLADDVVSTLRTKRLALEDLRPELRDGVPVGDLPVFALTFNDRIDPKAFVAAAHFAHAGGKTAVRIVPWAEVRTSERLHYVAATLEAEGRLEHGVAITPVTPLPKDTEIELRTGPLVSPQGPLRGPEVRKRFRTYGAFRALAAACSAPPCAPGDAIELTLSNPLALPLDPRTFRTTPPLVITSAEQSGTLLILSADARANTRYVIALPEHTRDVFGQQLAGERTLAVAVGPRRPFLQASSGGPDSRHEQGVLDPGDDEPNVRVKSGGVDKLRVCAERVRVEDYERYVQAIQDRWQQPKRPFPFARGKQCAEIAIADPSVLTETSIPLTAAFGPDHRHIVLFVEPLLRGKPTDHSQPLISWLTRSRTGLDYQPDGDHMQVWTTDLLHGTPLADVEVSFRGLPQRVRTDAGGFARLPLPRESRTEPFTLLARKDGDEIFSLEPPHAPEEPSTWQAHLPTRTPLMYALTDRQTYRPGEQVLVKGYARIREAGGAALSFPPAGQRFAYTLTGHDEQVVQKGEVHTDQFGEFSLQLGLPESATDSLLYLKLGEPGEGGTSLSFSVESYRRPSFEVELSPSAAVAYVGAKVSLRADAHYYTGGPLRNAQVRVALDATQTGVRIAAHPEFAFGAVDRRGDGADADDLSMHLLGLSDSLGRVEFETDATGAGTAEVLVTRNALATPLLVRAVATIQDQDHQAVAAQTSFTLHPARVYAGLSIGDARPERDRPLPVSVLVSELGGKLVAGVPVSVSLIPMIAEPGAEPLACSVSSREQPSTCTLTPPRNGPYHLVARLSDADGHPSESSLFLHVAGRAPAGLRQRDAVGSLLADREEYTPGDVAKLRIVPPFQPAVAWLRVHGVHGTQERLLELDGPSEVAIAIAADDYPVLPVSVRYAGAVADFKQIDVDDFTHHTALRVSPEQVQLRVDVTPRAAELAPGGELALDLAVAEPGGKPSADARISLFVVDEAALERGDSAVPAPLAAFYPEREAPPEPASTRGLLVDLARYHPESAGMRAGGAVSVAARKRFVPVAHFEPQLRTGQDGRVTTRFRLPDDLTRYRILAIASAGAARFGSGEARVRVHSELAVRLAPPRFLRPDDETELTVLVENTAELPRKVRVGLRVQGGRLLGPHGQELRLPARGRVPVRFRLRAGAAGMARVQVVARSGELVDVAEHALPVLARTSQQEVASYGRLARDAQAVEQVRIPEDALPDEGGLDVALSASSLLELRAAYAQVQSPGFEGAETFASRILASVALLRAEGQLANGERAGVHADLQRAVSGLRALLHWEGGYKAWPAHAKGSLFESLRAAHALELARREARIPDGFELQHARTFVAEHAEAAIGAADAAVRPMLTAYTLYIRALRGDDVRTQVAALLATQEASTRGNELCALLAMALPPAHAQARELVSLLRSRVAEAAQSAASLEPAAGAAIQASAVRSSALVLEALLREAPQDDLPEKLARGLRAEQRAGRYATVQDGAFALLALSAYLARFEPPAQNLEVSASLFGTPWQARPLAPGETLHFQLPLSAFTPGSVVPVQLGRKGEGALYYRVGLRSARPSLHEPAVDQGFTVERSYTGLDDPHDVERRPDGSYRIRAGARVRVQLGVIARSVSHAVMIVDPWPAGFEPTSRYDAEPGASTPYGAPAARFLSYEASYDERFEGLADTLRPESHRHSYVVRAIAPGHYRVPGVLVRQRNAPESFGRAATDDVEIVP